MKRIYSLIFAAVLLLATVGCEESKSMPRMAVEVEPLKTVAPTFTPDPPLLAKVEVSVEFDIPATPEPTVAPTPTPTPKPTVKPTIKPTSAPTPTPNPTAPYEEAARYIAKTIYGEARCCSTTEQAAVVWCILNRVDKEGSGTPSDVIAVVTAKYQFQGYRASNPVEDEHYGLAMDVIERWLLERGGATDVGRVLPQGYLWFLGDGEHNHFRNAYTGGTTWDWSLPSPYDN